MIDPFKGDHHVLMLKKKSRFERKLTFLNSLFHSSKKYDRNIVNCCVIRTITIKWNELTSVEVQRR